MIPGVLHNRLRRKIRDVVPDLALWMDFRHGVRESAFAVEGWHDMMGNGFVALSSGSGRPSLTGDGLVFNGTSHYLEVADNAKLRSRTGQTVFVVGKSSSSTVIRAFAGKWWGQAVPSGQAWDDWILAGNNLSNANYGGFLVNETTTTLRQALTGADITDGAWHVFGGRMTGAGGQVIAYRDGVAGTGVSISSPMSGAGAPMQIGRYAPAAAANPGYLACTIKAIVVVGKSTNLAEYTELQRILREVY